MQRWSSRLRNTWFHPRYIGTVYMRPALLAARPYARGVLLDIGCGVRPYEDIFKPCVSRYWGFDWPAPDSDSREDVVADGLRLPVAAETADTVLATELLEHLPDPAQFLAEVARVLRPRGL